MAPLSSIKHAAVSTTRSSADLSRGAAVATAHVCGRQRRAASALDISWTCSVFGADILQCWEIFNFYTGSSLLEAATLTSILHRSKTFNKLGLKKQNEILLFGILLSYFTLSIAYVIKYVYCNKISFCIVEFS